MSNKSTTIFQNAFIVNDLEASCEKWARTMGIGPFTLLENISLPNIIYRGTPGELHLSAALAASGDLQVELIQPHHDHPSVYRDFYPTGQEGFHHMGVLTDDLAASIADFEARGHSTICSGGDPEGTEIAYMDTWADALCLTELIRPADSYMDMSRMLQDEAQNWDGVTAILRS
jgi:methylmalonyl-CoA/ethylmalonyl-CoA epimerase